VNAHAVDFLRLQLLERGFGERFRALVSTVNSRCRTRRAISMASRTVSASARWMTSVRAAAMSAMVAVRRSMAARSFGFERLAGGAFAGSQAGFVSLAGLLFGGGVQFGNAARSLQNVARRARRVSAARPGLAGMAAPCRQATGWASAVASVRTLESMGHSLGAQDAILRLNGTRTALRAETAIARRRRVKGANRQQLTANSVVAAGGPMDRAPGASDLLTADS
jgi:hypothetical protein